MKTKIISINPCFYTELGHNYYYLKSVEEACKFLNWDFHALVPKKNILNGLPSNWNKAIKNPTVRVCFELIEKMPYKRPRKFVRARQRVSYYLSVYQALWKLLRKDKNHSKILLYEAFGVEDLSLLANLISFLPFKNLELWLIFRYPTSFMKEDAQKYKHLLSKIKNSKIQLKLITDTDLLQQDLNECFKSDLKVFPIPLPDDLNRKFNKNKAQPISCWWPGIVRQGKGLDLIQKFSTSNCGSNKLIKLIVAKSANLVEQKQGPHLETLDDRLSKEQYDDYLANSDFILLPYTDACYEKTSSNIFVEALLAGKIPLVYSDTWMAYELKKYSLPELVVDWKSSSLSNKIVAIHKNQEIKEKLAQMQASYSKFHNIKNFSANMKELLEKN